MASSKVVITEPEWISWDQAMRIMRAARVDYPWRVICGWCADEMIASKAAAMIGGGTTKKDVEIDPLVWRHCSKNRGAHVSALSGSIKTADKNPETDEVHEITILGTQFRKDQLLEILPPIGDVEIAAALAAQGGWLGGKDLPSPVEARPAKRGGGRKPQLERWHAFYMGAIALAKEGRLNRAGFNSQTELGEELLHLMGDDAFDADYVKSEVGQIYKRFAEG